jgi:hypothetical protein
VDDWLPYLYRHALNNSQSSGQTAVRPPALQKKIDMVRTTEYRQQIKTFRLKYVFLAGKIIRTARSVVLKLSEKHPYQEMDEKSLP